MIPVESLPHFEMMIYLPMVIIVLEKNRLVFEQGEFKLSRPYINLKKSAINLVQADLRDAKQYMREHNLKLLKGEVEKTTQTILSFMEDMNQIVDI